EVLIDGVQEIMPETYRVATWRTPTMAASARPRVRRAALDPVPRYHFPRRRLPPTVGFPDGFPSRLWREAATAKAAQRGKLRFLVVAKEAGVIRRCGEFSEAIRACYEYLAAGDENYEHDMHVDFVESMLEFVQYPNGADRYYEEYQEWTFVIGWVASTPLHD